MKNLMFITLSMGYGGIEQLICMFARSFMGRYNVTICCLDSVGALGTALKRENGIDIVCLNRNSKKVLDILLFYRLYKLLKKKQIHVLHSHNEASLFYGSIAGFLARIPVVVNTEHSRHYVDQRRIRSIEKRVMSFLNQKIICVSDELKKESIYKDKIRKSKLCTILNGIDNDAFVKDIEKKCSLRKALGIVDDQIIIGIVARLNPIKNHEMLIRAFHGLITKGFDVKLVIVGDGSRKEFLNGLVNELDLECHVFFLGARNDVHDLLPMFDVFVLCSLGEGLPLTILEAMSVGLPVVATSVGMNSKLVDDGLTGYLVSSNDVEQLEKKLAMLVLDKHLRESFGKRASCKAMKYDIKKTIIEYDNLYANLLDQRK